MPTAEHLQLGPAEGPGDPRRWRRAGLVAMAVVLVAAVGLTLRSPPGDVVVPPPPAVSPTPSASRSVVLPTTRPSTPSDRRTRVVADGRPLVDAPASWVLYAHSDAMLYRIQPGTGRVLGTPVLSIPDGAELLAVRGGVFLRTGEGDGVYVPDGGPARDLRSPLDERGRILPGRGGRVWFANDLDGSPTRPVLVDPNGSTAKRSAPLTGWFSPDGTGNLLLTDTGGAWELTDRGPRRITTGAVLAVGPAHYLLRTCDVRHRCTSSLRDRRSGKVRHLRVLNETGPGISPGLLSPDGRYVALDSYDPDGVSVALWDLRREQPVRSVDGDNRGLSGVSFSPDGRWLASADAGRLVLVETRSGRTVTPDLPVEPLRQVTGPAHP